MKLQYKALNSKALQDLANFECGSESWNDLAEFLLNDALEQHRSRFNRTFLFYADDDPTAYVTLSADSIRRQHV